MKQANKSILLQIMVCFSFFACTNLGDISKCRCMPEIVVTGMKNNYTRSDSVIASVFLSDTSYLRVTDSEFASWRIKPIYSYFNGDSVITITNLDTVIVKAKPISAPGKSGKGLLTVSVTFPHPNGGDVRISKSISYLLSESKSSINPSL